MSKVKLGILGTRRGIAFAEAAALLHNVEVTGFCGRNSKRNKLMSRLYPDTRIYDSWEQMLDDESNNAIVVANYADEHAPFAIEALKAGKHVLSEVVAFNTIAEGVELARTVKKTGLVYMFGENFCYMPFVQEMRRLYESGRLGELCYAEGEYVHWAADVMHMLVDLDIDDHWRLWIPPTFYNTHSVGPILRISGMRPVAVMAATGHIELKGAKAKKMTIETPAIEVVRLENGAIVKSLHGGPYPREPWQPWFSVGGSNGCIESNRWPDPSMVTTYFDGDKKPRTYRAKFRRHAKKAPKTQHWGADLFVVDEFVKAIRTGSLPDIDVHMGLDMTLVGNLAWRSILDGGSWIEIPDLRKESVRKKWQSDRYSCRLDTPEKYRLPNQAGAKGTVLPGKDVIEAIRKRQRREPYYKAMYRD